MRFEKLKNLATGLVAVAAAHSTAAMAATCDWPISSDPNLVNVAYPDSYATYWGNIIPMPSDEIARIRIEGRYPDARYFSFNVYDYSLSPTDAIADYELVPDAGGVNSFVDQQAPYGDTYTAYIEIGEKPESGGEPNTIYAGNVGGDSDVPVLGFGFLYRIYVSRTNNALDGGVGLPRLYLETSSGEAEIRLNRCGPFNQNPTGSSAVNDFTKEADYPFTTEQSVVPFVAAPQELTFRKFFGLGNVFARVGDDAIREVLGEGGDSAPSFQGRPGTGETNGGFLSNVHNSYGYMVARRDRGNLYVVRAKAPTWRGAPVKSEAGKGSRGRDRGAANGNAARENESVEQLRYWSICSNEFASQRYVDCVRDEELALDDEGYFTVVISDEADQPMNVIGLNAVNWLPWGGAYYDSTLIYRHMLPDPSFSEAIQNVGYDELPESKMGEYGLRGLYCDKGTIESVDGSGPGFAKRMWEACGG